MFWISVFFFRMCYSFESMARPYGAYIFLAGKTDGNSSDTRTSLRRYHLIQFCFQASLMCASTSQILFLRNVKIWTLPCSAVELGDPCHLPSLWSTLCSTRHNVPITAFTGQVLISHLRFQSNEGALWIQDWGILSEDLLLSYLYSRTSQYERQWLVFD